MPVRNSQPPIERTIQAAKPRSIGSKASAGSEHGEEESSLPARPGTSTHKAEIAMRHVDTKTNPRTGVRYDKFIDWDRTVVVGTTSDRQPWVHEFPGDGTQRGCNSRGEPIDWPRDE